MVFSSFTRVGWGSDPEFRNLFPCSIYGFIKDFSLPSNLKLQKRRTEKRKNTIECVCVCGKKKDVEIPNSPEVRRKNNAYYLDVKRFIGRQWNDISVQNDLKSWAFRVIDNDVNFFPPFSSCLFH